MIFGLISTYELLTPLLNDGISLPHLLTEYHTVLSLSPPPEEYGLELGISGYDQPIINDYTGEST